MRILFKTVLYGVIGYLVYTAFAPGVSFWKEFFMILSAPFILFCQIIPTVIFTGINSLAEFIDMYTKTNPDAAMLGWVSLFVGFLALGITLIYYVALFIAFVMFMNRISIPNYSNETPEQREIREITENRPLTDADRADAAFWENQKLNFFGLTTNKEIIESDVKANAIAQALRK